MMKITYEFDTSDENFSAQELEEFRQGPKMALALSEILEHMRQWLKYDACPVIDEYYEFWEKLPEEKKQFYKENPTPDIDRMVEEIRDIINDNVDMGSMGY